MHIYIYICVCERERERKRVSMKLNLDAIMSKMEKKKTCREAVWINGITYSKIHFFSLQKDDRNNESQWDLMQLTSFCTAKETIKKTKRQFTEWEKIVSNDTTDKGLIFRICKQLIQQQKSQQPNGKMGKRPE